MLALACSPIRQRTAGGAKRVTGLANSGVKVIADDVGFFAQPYFEDGTAANAY